MVVSGEGPLTRPAAASTLVLLGALSVSCGGGESRETIRLAHGLPESHPVHEAMLYFAEHLAETSNGELAVDVYPSEQLGTERELLELVQIGSVDMTKVSASVLEAFVPEYAVLSLPYLFRDEDHRQNVFHGATGERLLEAGREQGLVGLTFYDAGSRSFYFKDRPIRRPSDLAGMKVRTQESGMAIQTIRALGGAATPIAWGELYTSLQQGVVDGAENNPPSFFLSRHYEVCRYYSLDEHTATPDVLLMGATAWSRLTPRQREWVKTSARASADVQLRLWRKATREALAAVIAAGVEVIEVDKAPFAEAVEPILERYGADPRMRDWIDAIRRTP